MNSLTNSFTIYDIAEKAGVSIATVSRVLNKSSKVSEVSRIKVQKAIDKYGYIPNALARGLSGIRTGIVGIIVPVISDINHARMVSGIERELLEKGFHSLIACTNLKESKRNQYLHIMEAKKVDAIIVIGSFVSDTENAQDFEKVAGSIPVIVVNGFVKAPGVYCVYADEYTIVREITCELMQKGCQGLLYINDSHTFSGTQKLRGFNEALQSDQHGAVGTTIFVDTGSEPVQSACDAVLQTIREGTQFSAVMSADDILAIGALKALRCHGLSMPVIGFNNTKYAACSTPELSSIDINASELCSLAVETLSRVMMGEAVASSVKVPAQFIQRETYTR